MCFDGCEGSMILPPNMTVMNAFTEVRQASVGVGVSVVIGRVLILICDKHMIIPLYTIILHVDMGAR